MHPLNLDEVLRGHSGCYVNQIRSANGYPPAGYLQPFLYKETYGLNGSGSQYVKDFHDVKAGNNGWKTGVGWDAATGLGSMNAADRAFALADNASA